ncbi:MAG: aldehyde dehydrogenase family protein, partial [Pseudomonadota bacterium]
AVEAARRDPDGWRKNSLSQRHRVLANVAQELRRARGDLIGAAAADTGKVFIEADPEVSEAVDFAEFYPFSAQAYDRIDTVTARGKGVGLVISPWNFPVAIPCGGIVATLASGNTCIFKPSSKSILTAWVLVQCFWRAGVSRNVLQFLPCSGSKVGGKLTNHPQVDFIILTGGTDTGLRIIQQRPGVYLAAETGGKNATIVTDMADRDQAVKNVVYSAFGNCGQKCSATSLLILEKSIYDDEHFQQQLVDAAGSLKAGSAWSFENKLAALIEPPSTDLHRTLTTLEPGETWALKPEMLDNNPYMWSPGIKYGVKPLSYTHMTEFFGPVLGVMQADNLEQAIEYVNLTGYGLTSGLESLDPREQELWKESLKAGNLYLNRGTTGAITLRQPFGGMGKSALGPGIKAGGPDYVAQFMDFDETGPPKIGALAKESRLLRLAQKWKLKIKWGWRPEIKDELYNTIRAIESYLYWVEQKFGREHDFFHLRGQDNVLRYLPLGRVVVRLHERDSLFEVLARLAAAHITGCTPLISLPPGLQTQAVDFLGTEEGRDLLGSAPVLIQADEELAAGLIEIDRLRYASPERVPETVRVQAAQYGFFIACSPVYMEGRLELLWYYRQQSICHNYHRYGNLGERAWLDSVHGH